MKRTDRVTEAQTGGGGRPSSGAAAPQGTRHGCAKFFTKKKGPVQPKAGVSEKGRPSDPELLILGVERLVALALNTKDPASRLAGKILAYVDALIAADREKLCEANEAYRRERPKLGKLLREMTSSGPKGSDERFDCARAEKKRPQRRKRRQAPGREMMETFPTIFPATCTVMQTKAWRMS
jgi:hypothetical protein